MKPLQTLSPHDYLTHIITNWDSWVKHHPRITRTLQVVLEENARLREENAHLKVKLEHIHSYLHEEKEN